MFDLKTYDRIEIKVPKGRKEAIQAVASAQGESLCFGQCKESRL